MVAPGEAEHQIRSLQAAGHVGAVCSHDTDFAAMGCDTVIYASTLSGDQVSFLNWADAEKHIRSANAVTPFITGPTGNDKHADLDLAVKRAMLAYGVKTVVRLTFHFLKNDYGNCGVGIVTIGVICLRLSRVLCHRQYLCLQNAP